MRESERNVCSGSYKECAQEHNLGEPSQGDMESRLSLGRLRGSSKSMTEAGNRTQLAKGESGVGIQN